MNKVLRKLPAAGFVSLVQVVVKVAGYIASAMSGSIEILNKNRGRYCYCAGRSHSFGRSMR